MLACQVVHRMVHGNRRAFNARFRVITIVALACIGLQYQLWSLQVGTIEAGGHDAHGDPAFLSQPQEKPLLGRSHFLNRPFRRPSADYGARFPHLPTIPTTEKSCALVGAGYLDELGPPDAVID